MTKDGVIAHKPFTVRKAAQVVSIAAGLLMLVLAVVSCVLGGYPHSRFVANGSSSETQPDPRRIEPGTSTYPVMAASHKESTKAGAGEAYLAMPLVPTMDLGISRACLMIFGALLLLPPARQSLARGPPSLG